MSTIIKSNLEELHRLVESPLDPEYEAWRAARRKVSEIWTPDVNPTVYRRNRKSERGSFLTGTSTEVIYSNGAAGTAKNTFTTEFTINDTTGMGPFPVLPPYFFLPTRGTSQSVRIVARGIYSTTSAPTWQTFVRFNSGAPAVPPTGPNVGSTAATALGSTQTNLVWEHEEDVQMVTMGANGANSTLRGLGIFTAALTASTSLALGILGGGASPGTVATFDISTTTYVTFSAACGTSSGSNSIQLLQLIIMGLN